VTERLRLLTASLLVGLLGVGFWYASTATHPSDEENGGGEIEAAAEAVRAWGSFAASGDVRPLAGWFAVDGPQLSQLLSEVESIVPGGTYDFSLSEAELVGPGLVRGSVIVTAGDEQKQKYLWDIELVQEDGHWKVWTVRTSP